MTFWEEIWDKNNPFHSEVILMLNKLYRLAKKLDDASQFQKREVYDMTFKLIKTMM